jgi:MFS superfamily sulfate permease-like transporter
VASPEGPIAALIASLLAAILAKPGSPAYVELAYAQALVCTLIFLLFAVFKLGFLANFLSEPVLVGFIAGLALEILTSQVEKILGIHTTADRFFPELWEIITKIPDAMAWSVVVGVATVIAIVVLRKLAPALRTTSGSSATSASSQDATAHAATAISTEAGSAHHHSDTGGRNSGNGPGLAGPGFKLSSRHCCSAAGSDDR